MKHLSLFSGIGGFDLAAEWMGWENIEQIEIDPFCIEVLKKNFPNVPKCTDIKDFNGSDYTGRVDIITGGFPCQPFSQAGKRKGKDDERHLWPEMLRVISTVKPTWVVAENVRGLLSIEQGVVFEQVCLDLENIGYEVQPVIIPAVAVNAPHRRDRVWFIAYSNENANRRRREQTREEKGLQRISGQALDTRLFGRTDQNVTNTKRTRHQGKINQKRSSARRDCWLEQWNRNWAEVATELCCLDDGLSVELGKFKRSKAGHRNEQIKAYGNAIVPQVAYQIFNSLPFLDKITYK